MGSGPQTTAWLYMFWHAGFPLAVIAYARLKDERRDSVAAHPPLARSVLYGIGVVCAAVVGLTLLATSGHRLLPAIMQGNVKLRRP